MSISKARTAEILRAEQEVHEAEVVERVDRLLYYRPDLADLAMPGVVLVDGVRSA